jgi:thioredoxin 1
MGATKAVTDDTFEADVLQSDKTVLVDYWAEWCGPCKMIAPILEAIADEHGDKLDVVKLNVDENPKVTQQYGILNIPTLGVFSNGQVVRELVGARCKSALLRELASAPGKLLSHAALLRKVWGPGYETETEYTRVYVRRLRAKLEDPDGPPLIVTEPRAGYRMVASAE